MKLDGIFIYPVKSLGGISLQSALARERGLQYDRRWMLVDMENKFITQREYPVLADLACEVSDDSIIIQSKTIPDRNYSIPKEITSKTNRLEVRVWDDTFEAALFGEVQDEFFTDVLGTPCRLVFMDTATTRLANENYTRQPTQVGFADSYPYLIISQASLHDLNSRLAVPLPMERFRPNLVISGCGPYEEDQMKEIKVGDLKFRIVKQCPRCSITTIDTQTYRKGEEPLATLSEYRKVGNEVMFGSNAIAMDFGRINVNDPVEILT